MIEHRFSGAHVTRTKPAEKYIVLSRVNIGTRAELGASIGYTDGEAHVDGPYAPTAPKVTTSQV